MQHQQILGLEVLGLDLAIPTNFVRSFTKSGFRSAFPGTAKPFRRQFPHRLCVDEPGHFQTNGAWVLVAAFDFRVRGIYFYHPSIGGRDHQTWTQSIKDVGTRHRYQSQNQNPLHEA